MRTLTAGATYFGLVFSTGFLLGTIRTLWVVPHLGIRTGELLEMPLMFVAIILAAGWINRGIDQTSDQTRKASARISVGVVALVLLLVAETLMGVVLLGLSPIEVFTQHDIVSGSVYYVMLGIFAGMPWLLWKYGQRDAV